MTYQIELDRIMNECPSLMMREEDALYHMLLVNGCGYEWDENGNLSDVFADSRKPKNAERSIAYIASKQGAIRKDTTYDEKSYWFDFHLVEYNNKMQGERIPGDHFSYDYCNLTRVPDNVTEEWARAIAKCCEWIWSTCTNIGKYIEHHKLSRCRFTFGGTEEWRTELREQNPDATGYEIDCMYADKIEAHAIEQLTKDCDELIKAAAYASAFCHTLYDIPTGLPEMQDYPMDTSKPSWYVEIEDRNEHDREPYNTKPDKCILEELRHKKTPEELEKEKKQNEIMERLMKEIIAEEK